VEVQIETVGLDDALGRIEASYYLVVMYLLWPVKAQMPSYEAGRSMEAIPIFLAAKSTSQ